MVSLFFVTFQDPEVRILSLLRAAGARPGFRPRGEEDEDPKQPNEEKEAEKIKDSTATIGIASVLIITISFAAAFQFPGGYSTGDDNKQPAGTPELAKVYSFEAFVVANNLAALCSAISTFSVMFTGVSAVSLRMRKRAFLVSILFLNGSARSLAAAFAFGTYAVAVAPVARAAAVLTWVFTSFLMADIAGFTWIPIKDQRVLLNRRGWYAVCLQVAISSVVTALLPLWPYVVIVGFLACIKIFGIH